MDRSRVISAFRLGVAAIAVAAWPGIAAAQTITEFVTPTTGSQPSGIAAGPDGNLWFTENAGNKIGAIDTHTSVFREFAVPTAASQPREIVLGPDDNLWFTEFAGNKIGKITAAGVISEFPIPTPNGNPIGIASGPDGALWFTQSAGNKIGRITTAGVISEFPIPTPSSNPIGITAGPDGALWFTEADAGKIGRITTAGVVTEFAIPTAVSRPRSIAPGGDGALWFTELRGNKIGRITTAGVITEFAVPTPNGQPFIAAAGPDGALWFTEISGSRIGRMTYTGSGPALVSSVLPASRSVVVGSAATAFDTTINTGTTIALNCGLALGTSIPATFSYQTTNPTTNAVTGNPNNPVAIQPNNGSQSYVFAITPTAAFPPTDVTINTNCDNANAPPTVVGLNTIQLSATSSPGPDIVALAATVSNDGIVTIPGATGTGAFAVATVNVGTGAAIQASADTGSATLPVQIGLCLTDPNANCTTPIGPTVNVGFNANATPTFSIFVTGTGTVAFNPAVNRIFVRFKDTGLAVRGSTSVAVRTQ